MKTLFVFFLPAFIVANFFTSNSTKELTSNSSYFFQSGEDSSETEELLGEPKKGLDGMFNERGFYGSNSFSYDENEIINDFNGNLQYTIPLHHIKGAGDMNIDVAVNYNGSMSYLAYTDARSNVLAGDIPPQQNITAPGWIISVNGMAVQTLNFETHLITQKVSGDGVSDGNVKLLTNGYHVTRINQVQSGEKDKISLLQGDGSILTLENLENNKYDGYYYSTNKKNYARAKVVKFNDLPLLENQEYYRKRTVFLTKGDGLTYIYQEEYDSYNDYRFEHDIRIMKPRSFYLQRIEDRFGNFININYGIYSVPHYGKQIVEEITASWDNTGASNINFLYNSINDNGKIRVRNSVKGVYQINTSGFTFNPSVNDYHQAKVTSIVNPLNQQIIVNSGTYERTYENLKYHSLEMPEIHFSFTNTNDVFCRVNSFTNYNGGVRQYYYKGNADMSIDMIWQEGRYYTKGTPAAFAGQGRDAFYTNMIDSVIFKASASSNPYRRISYLYGYTDNDNDYEWNPVDPDDLFTTTKNIERAFGAPADTITASGFSQVFHYKNYEVYDGSINPSVSDFPGEIVLFKTDEKAGVDSVKTTEYFAEIGTSFLDTMVKVTFAGGSIYNTVTRYEHHNNFPFPSTDVGRKFDNPIKKTIQIDAFNQKTVTDFSAIYDTSYVYPGAKFGPGYTLPNFQKVYFYLIDQPTKVIKYVSESDTLYKETNVYIDTNFDARGYLRQHVAKRIHDKNSLNNYIQYVSNYSRGDTTGQSVHGNNIHQLPGKEGNLQYTIDPNGYYTRYYYHPISANEFISGTSTPDYEGVVGEEMDGPNPPPQVSYYKVYDNNTSVLNNSYWEDRRLPVRVDKYASGTKYNSTYSSYNLSGLPTRTFDNNKFVTAFEFDNVDRLRTGTLPYDFNNTISYDSIAYDTVYWYSDTVITPTTVGQYNVLTNQIWASTNCLGDYYQKCNLAAQFNGDTYNDNFRPYLLYDPNFLNQFDTLYNAAYVFYPINFSSSISGTTMNIHAITDIIGDINIGYGQNIPNLTTTNFYCQTNTFLQYIYQCYNSVDIKGLLNSYLGTPSNFKGITFSYSLPSGFPEPPPPHTVSFLINSSCIGTHSSDCGNWSTYYAPRIKIQGVKRKVSERIIKVYQKATLQYVYDDVNNKISTYSKLDGIGHSARQVRTDNLFDGFYRITEKRNFYNPTGYSVSQNQFNYLDKPHSTTDFLGHKTKSFYNKYMNVSRIENPDTSFSLVSESFQNGLSYTFGSVSGPVNKQILTDETGRFVHKYTDVLGNLRREVKFVESPIPQNPLMDELITDYRYDSLYRVTEVRTPANKRIYYHYDGYGRVRIKQTPDAGTSQFGYDRNGNMTFTRDANQINQGNNIYTFSTYDGMNRLTGLGISDPGGSQPVWDNVDFETEFSDATDNPSNLYANFLTINVYDTLIASDYSFISAPSGYTSTLNNTRGRLVVTAYRTLKSEDWSYKWYKYDARGRVIKMWNTINDFDTKITEYTYNSGDVPVITTYQIGESDFRKFRNGYDTRGRLAHVDYWDPNISPDPELPQGDNPASQWINLAEYTHTPNSMIEHVEYKMSDEQPPFKYTYNSRNWITSFNYDTREDLPVMLNYSLGYEANGNVSQQIIEGEYQKNFANADSLNIEYTYDASNRLTRSDFSSPSASNAYELLNQYDFDGNIVSLDRHGSDGYIDDDFAYNYTSGTNRLTRVTGSSPQFTYDNNGNMISDWFNNNGIIEYDHRNLITKITRVIISGTIFEPDVTYVTIYKYDDEGNRIRKLVMMTTNPEPEPIGGNIDAPPYGWTFVRNEFFVRGVDGDVIAEYNSDDLEQHNLYAGSNNFGKINPDASVNYYLKDHLGSVRAAINMGNNVISAQDFDAWGYLMEDRQYESTLSEYKFTGKERDNESNYDYFGARYYDSRIARWGSIDPLFEKHIDWTPYNYVLGNPMGLIDPDGLAPNNLDPKYGVDPGGFKQAKIAGQEIISRISSTYSKLFSGDFSGALNQGMDNTQRVFTSTIVLDAIPDPTLGLLPTPLTFSKTAKALKVFTVGENIGKADDIGLGWLKNAPVTTKNIQKLSKELTSFMGSDFSYKETNKLLKLGNLKKTGKEVRVGFDKSHPYSHIDIERLKPGKKYKDLKLKISTKSTYF